MTDAPQVSAPATGTQFITKIIDYPVVSSTLTYAADTYGKIKTSSPLANLTLTTAEKSVHYAAEQIKPVVQRLEKPIELADNLACKGLDKIEELAPSIKKTPTEILSDTKQIYNDTLQTGIDKYEGIKNYGTDKYAGIKNYGNEKISEIKNYGMQKATDLINGQYGQLVNTTVDGALNLTESYVDYYLPPTEDEKKDGQENGEKEQAYRERVGSLSNKMKTRVYSNFALKVQTLHAQSQEPLNKLHLTIYLIEYARDNINNPKQLLSTTLETIQTRAAQLWELLNKEENEASVEHRLLIVARHLTHQLVNTYQTASTLTLPQDLQDKLSTALTYAQEIKRNIAEIQGITDLSNTIGSHLTQRIQYLESLFSNQPTEENIELESNDVSMDTSVDSEDNSHLSENSTH